MWLSDGRIKHSRHLRAVQNGISLRRVVLLEFVLCLVFLQTLWTEALIASDVTRRHSPTGASKTTSFPTKLQSTQEDEITTNKDTQSSLAGMDRRGAISAMTKVTLGSSLAATTAPSIASAATMNEDTYWPFWLALPVFPFDQRRTLMRQVGPRVWVFDQLIGIYYVHVPIRMTVIAIEEGLLVYAPVAATKECLGLLQPLIDKFGPVRKIILPTVAVEHKVLAGPFARQFPEADFYVTDRQYSFPISLPDQTLGFPSWTKTLPSSSSASGGNILGEEFEFEVLTVQPGIASMYQDVAVWHKPTKTLLVCDALFATTQEPPEILTAYPEYRKALLFHARDSPSELPQDTKENRQKGWRRIVLLFNFFFPLYAAQVDLGVAPLKQLDFSYEFGWGGWMPVTWNKDSSYEKLAFDRYTAGGKPTLYTIVQIILSRGNSGQATLEWLEKVKQWDFDTVIPAHLDAPLRLGPQDFAETFYSFLRPKPGEELTVNQVRYCDEDVAFLRGAEEGFLSFSVFPSRLGPLRGKPCGRS